MWFVASTKRLGDLTCGGHVALWMGLYTVYLNKVGLETLALFLSSCLPEAPLLAAYVVALACLVAFPPASAEEFATEKRKWTLYEFISVDDESRSHNYDLVSLCGKNRLEWRKPSLGEKFIWGALWVSSSVEVPPKIMSLILVWKIQKNPNWSIIWPLTWSKKELKKLYLISAQHHSQKLSL